MYLQSLKTISSKLTIFYDGQCPLCLAEIHFLKQHNHKKLLDFVSLQESNTLTDGISCERALQTIHARLGEKQIISGPEVFFEAYKRTDLRLVNYIFSFGMFRFLYAKFYAVFARHRQLISRMIGPFMLNLVYKKYPVPMPIKTKHIA